VLERVVVAIEYSFAGYPLDVPHAASCPAVSSDDVATVPDPDPPVAVIVTGDVPMTVNEVQEAVPEHDAVVVATFANVFGPEKYARFPWTAAVEVERPFHVSVRDVVRSPPPPNGKFVVMDTAFDAGV